MFSVVGQAEARDIQQFFIWAARHLEAAGIHRPRWTAEQLLGHRLKVAPAALTIDPPSVSPEQRMRFQADVAARCSGVPLQYLLGVADFYGREFEVGPGVFIPRPETEVLVEAVVQEIRSRPESVAADIGTGSGAIAVTLALECPNSRVIGIDQSRQALIFAERNRVRHRCSVEWQEGDLCRLLAADSVDLVAANLPYLNPEEAATIWPREIHWEPRLAVDGGVEGFSLLYRLMKEGRSVVRPGGRLFLECHAGQAGKIRACAPACGWRVDRILPDLAGIPRVAVLSLAEVGEI